MANQIYQYSLVSALMHGICREGVTIQHVLQHGDHGIGTIGGLNGEVIILDGKAYHFPPDGALRAIENTDTIHFIMVTRFQPTFHKHLPSISTESQFPLSTSLSDALISPLPAQQNRFLSLRIEAFFSRIRFRVIPAQTEPREPLAHLAQRQCITERDQVHGVLFGFWSPPYSSGFSVPGFHLHFLSCERTFGGHVMGFVAHDVKLEAAGIGNYHIELPASEEFNAIPINNVSDKNIHAAEGGLGC